MGHILFLKGFLNPAPDDKFLSVIMSINQSLDSHYHHHYHHHHHHHHHHHYYYYYCLFIYLFVYFCRIAKAFIRGPFRSEDAQRTTQT